MTRRTATVLAVLGCVLLVPAEGAGAGATPHGSVVSDNPANVTPNVEADSTVVAPVVQALAARKGTIYAGGEFRTVSNAAATTTYPRHHIMSFDAVTGAMRPFAPRFNGPVWAIEPRGKAVFVGGEFTAVNGVPRQGLVKLNATSGEVIRTFAPPFTTGGVTEVQMARGQLIVGGTFPAKLRAFDPATGRGNDYLNLAIAGSVAANAGDTEVYRFAVSPDERRLVAVGNFTTVNGAERWRAFMLNLRRGEARLSAWSYPPLIRRCDSTFTTDYLRDVDFSPDGSYFVMVAAGSVPQDGGVGTDICDAAARFETAVTAPIQPTWINYTGGDTLHSVVITGAAVYVQGHQRWLDNPDGDNTAGPGAVEREGIGAIDPTTGLALPWNPGKTRGIGGKDLLATPSGLWVASDGALFNGERRARIAFCPL